MLQTQGGTGGTRVSPGRQKQPSQDSGAALGKYPAAARLLLHGKIRSKKQLVPPYLHGVNFNEFLGRLTAPAGNQVNTGKNTPPYF